MFHSGTSDHVRKELDEHVSAAFAEYCFLNPADIPVTLSCVTDAKTLRDMILNRSLKAPMVVSRSLKASGDSFGAAGTDFCYGIDLAESFLAGLLLAETDPVRRNFCQEVIANLNPHGTWFESFMIRFFEEERTARIAGDACSGYAVVMRTAGMGISHSGLAEHGNLSFAKAIYSQAEQLACLATYYSACEDCYVDAIEWHGEANQENFLCACWDRFRMVVGELSRRFRNPSLAEEKEWVATALKMSSPKTEVNNDDVEFELRDNAFIPYVRVRMPAKPGTDKPSLPISKVVIDRAVQSPAAEEYLRAFLRKNEVFGVVVTRATLPAQAATWNS